MVENQSSPFVTQVHLQRLQQLSRYYSLNIATTTDVQTLADQLSCSERNIAKLMKTLASIGWISWKPGRGRGNKSEITLLESFESALMSVLEQHCHKGHLSEAARYADLFGYEETFRKKLPSWLMQAQESLKNLNTLVTLVPYSLPIMHPLWAHRSSSRLYIEAMFDTLLKYDNETGSIRPHLAHHYEFRENELWLRIRPDVYFHNGEKLTAQHVAKCIEDRVSKPHNYQILYRHILKVVAEGLWVVIKMSQCHESILYLLSGADAPIYLDRVDHDEPFGTGPYMIETSSEHHWVLVKNPNYFATGGFIERAEFWTIDEAERSVRGHIVHHGYSMSPKVGADKVSLQTGCDVIEFHHQSSLSMDEKSWIFHQAREFCRRRASDYLAIANSVTGYHQNKGVFLHHSNQTKPTRPLRVFVTRETEPRLQLLEHFRQQGVEVKLIFVEQPKHTWFDFALGGYVFPINNVFGYYKWLLTSSVFTSCLSKSQQSTYLSIVDQLMLASDTEQDFLNELYRCEDWLIQNGVFVPLWRDSESYDVANSLHGLETDSAGILSLQKLWFDS
ncbi:SgrR family transcriptional regulator [Vibrio europaeus]|uniref:SgrR family transcriptional regulator n=1 Tax=Vibrio europaeus TaxID=300876 RepID=UPI0023419AA6|nr:SgrR family transcriptional regulator [Vibrio europaeus]MDC5849793.1 SgrR family transcriptional regulator [Vibrio europaeus]